MSIVRGALMLAGLMSATLGLAAGLERSGGQSQSGDLLQQALPGMPAALAARFDNGLAIFNTPFQAGTAVPPRVAGLGPRFNLPSCDACHNSGGRGGVPEGAEPPAQATVHARVRSPGDGASRPYVMRLDAIPGITPDGRARVIWSFHDGRYADGERYTLREPRVEVSDRRPDLGTLEATSLRVPPALAGLGLLESIPETTLCPTDGGSAASLTGRCAQVRDVRGRLRMGRFGWKATQADVESQTSDALATEMGIVTRWKSPPEQSGAPAEMNDADLAALVFLQRNSQPPPPARSGSEPGRALFARLGCAACHHESWMTGVVADAPWLSRRRIAPYTDLRLHEMGPGLGAASGEGAATASEWRTAPLWGLSLPVRSGAPRTYLHDGRARDLAEAILWHGGEGQASRDRFASSAREEREALIGFLGSL